MENGKCYSSYNIYYFDKEIKSLNRSLSLNGNVFEVTFYMSQSWNQTTGGNSR